MSEGVLYFDDLAVGSEWVSGERVVTAEDVAGFAELTGDRNPVHLDPAFARTTPFRRTIAHGLLGLSLAGGLSLSAPRLKVVALVRLEGWEFHAPVFVGETIRVRQSVESLELQGRGRRGLARLRVEVLTADGRLAQSGVTALLLEVRARAAA